MNNESFLEKFCELHTCYIVFKEGKEIIKSIKKGADYLGCGVGLKICTYNKNNIDYSGCLRKRVITEKKGDFSKVCSGFTPLNKNSQSLPKCTTNEREYEHPFPRLNKKGGPFDTDSLKRY